MMSNLFTLIVLVIKSGQKAAGLFVTVFFSLLFSASPNAFAQSIEVHNGSGGGLPGDVAVLSTIQPNEVVVYGSSNGGVPSKWGIWASIDNVNSGTPFLVHNDLSRAKYYARVAALDNDLWVVTFWDSELAVPRVYFSIFENDGTPVLQDQLVDRPTSKPNANQGFANVAALPNGRFAIIHNVSWSSGAPSVKEDFPVVVQVFDTTNGLTQSAPIEIGTVGVSGVQHTFPAITAAGLGLVAAWTEREYIPDRQTVKARRLIVGSDTNGNPVVTPSGAEFVFLKHGKPDSTMPSLETSIDGAGLAGIAAVYYTGNATDKSNTATYKKFDVNVDFYSVANLNLSTPPPPQHHQPALNITTHCGTGPDITSLARGAVVVAWQDEGATATTCGSAPYLNQKSWLSRVRAKQGVVSTSEIVLPSAKGKQTVARVDAYAQCGFIAKWGDWSSAQNARFFKRRFRRTPCPGDYDVTIEKKLVDPVDEVTGHFAITVTNLGDPLPVGTVVEIHEKVPSDLYLSARTMPPIPSPVPTGEWTCNKGTTYKGQPNVLQGTGWSLGSASKSANMMCRHTVTQAVQTNDILPLLEFKWNGRQPYGNEVTVKLFESNGTSEIKETDQSNNSAKGTN